GGPGTAVEADGRRCRGHRTAGHGHDGRLGERGPGGGRRAVPGAPGAAEALVLAADRGDPDLGRGLDLDLRADAAEALGEQGGDTAKRGAPPLALAPVCDGEVRQVEGRPPVGTARLRDDGTVGVGAVRGRAAVVGAQGGGGGHQPTDPSIWSSMRRLSSRAYSMGSSRAMGSTNPRTIMAMASVSSMPRDMR